MRKVFMGTLFAVAFMGFNGEAQAQFCPGTAG